MPTANDEPPISLQDLREKVQSEHDRLEALPAAGDVARAGSLLSAAWFLEQLDGLIESSPVLPELILDTTFETAISGYDVEMAGTETEFLIKAHRADCRLQVISDEMPLPLPQDQAVDLLVAVGILERTEHGARSTPAGTPKRRLTCRMTFSVVD